MIRRATLSDASDIARVVNAAFQVEREFRHGERTSAAEIRKLLEKDPVLVADLDGTITGAVLVRVTGPVGYFGMLAVDPQAGGAGLGRSLLDAAEDHCRRAGCSTMTLSTGEERTDVIRWYERRGYRLDSAEVSTDAAFKRPIRVVHMSRQL